MIKKEKPLIVANWKANPETLKLAKAILSGIKSVARKYKNVEVVVCPPVVYLQSLKTSVRPLGFGAQDIFTERGGAYTGEVGFEALLDTKIRYAIVGHSERRAIGESNASINKKIKIALGNNLKPILCVGESKRDESLEYLQTLKEQIKEALFEVSKNNIKNIIIAYEPVWAIGKSAKREASPKEIEEIVIFIKRVVSDMYAMKSLPPLKILYGGSVSGANANLILKEGGVDGLLVGRASLTMKTFAEIIQNIQ